MRYAVLSFLLLTPALGQPAPDGLWLGRTSGGSEIWLLVKDNRVAWFRTVLSLPAECAYGRQKPKAIVKRRTLQTLEAGAGVFRDGAAEAEYKRGPEPFVEQTVVLKARLASPAELSGEVISTAQGDRSVLEKCSAKQALSWTAHRASAAEVAESTLTLEERREAGEKDAQRPPADGVWVGQTAEGAEVSFLLLNHTLVWFRTGIALPDECRMDRSGSGPKVRIAYPDQADWTGDGFTASGTSSEPLLSAEVSIVGKKTGQSFAGQLQYAAVGDSSFLEKCKFQISSGWTARQVPVAEAKARLSIQERVELGESIPLLKKFEFGTIEGNECGKAPFVAAAVRPFQLASPATHLAYRIEINPEAAPLVQEVTTNIEPALDSGTRYNTCTDRIQDGMRSVPGVITTVLQRIDGAALRPGKYRFSVRFNHEPAPAYTEAFVVK